MILNVVLLAIAFAIVLYAADLLIKGASSLAAALGISPLVVGLTVVAFGTSAPELFVSVAAALRGSSDVALGNVVGSNIFNLFMIIGISSLFAPVAISAGVVRREYPIMLLGFALLFLMTQNQLLERYEGGVLFVGILAYVALQIALIKFAKIPLDSVAEAEEVPRYGTLKSVILIVLGLVGLIFGSEILVSNATVIARSLGVSELVIGLTIVAIGTSLPELATTAVAALKGQSDLAVGNAIGSNIFNVFAVLGLTSLVQPISIAQQALSFDLPFMLIASLVLWPVLYFTRRVGRLFGFAMLFSYCWYILQLF